MLYHDDESLTFDLVWDNGGWRSATPVSYTHLQFVWNIYANNDVVVPTGGCDVSAHDVTVTLPDYPGRCV